MRTLRHELQIHSCNHIAKLEMQYEEEMDQTKTAAEVLDHMIYYGDKSASGHMKLLDSVPNWIAIRVEAGDKSRDMTSSCRISHGRHQVHW